MADYRAQLAAVDQAITLLTRYQEEISDVTAALRFMLEQQQAALERQIRDCRQRLDELPGDSPEARRESRRLAGFQTLLGQYLLYRQDPWTAYQQAAATTGALVEQGGRACGSYLKKLSGAARRAAGGTPAMGGREEYTVVIDSRKSPQSAEHIRAAMAQGMPSVFTIDRSGRDRRRAQNLHGRPVRQGTDRDEWPAAVFAESENATVFPVEAGDNRSSGGSLGWQIRGLPDGSRVRVRVI